MKNRGEEWRVEVEEHQNETVVYDTYDVSKKTHKPEVTGH